MLREDLSWSCLTLVQWVAGPTADPGFEYMQKAETARMDETAAASCMEKLLADFVPCKFVPLLLEAAAAGQTPELQVHTWLLSLFRWESRPLNSATSITCQGKSG